MKTSICAIIKNEQRFLKEWIEWHLNIGFNAIHLFEDKGSDSHEDITNNYNNVYLRRYENDSEVKDILKDQGSSHRQTVLYQWFGDNYKDVYDWVAFIDLDEFIKFHNGYDLSMLCNEFEPYSCVLLNWRMIGANGNIKRPNSGVIEAYNNVVELNNSELSNSCKPFCNLKRWKGLISHHVANGYVNTLHNENKNLINYEKVSLDHYFTKSWEDWCDRIFNRGATQNGHRRLEEFFIYNKDMEYLKEELINSVKDKSPFGLSIDDDDDKVIVYHGGIKKITTRQRLIEDKNINFNGYLIFDLGFYNGDTSSFYLENCGNVIGIDCNNTLFEQNNEKYSKYISNGQLKLINKCITDKDNDTVKFYVSNFPSWSSCNKEIAERERESVEIDVKTITLSSLIKEYGCPIYCKIDIEGNDFLAVRSLKDCIEKPKYISVEAECFSKGQTETDISMLDELKNVGYNKFMIMDQRMHCFFKFDFTQPHKWYSYEESKKEMEKLKNDKWDYGVWADIYACI